MLSIYVLPNIHQDVELFLFNIHTFSGVHEIIEDTLDLHVALEPATPQESNAKMEFKLNPPHQKLMAQRLQWQKMQLLLQRTQRRIMISHASSALPRTKRTKCNQSPQLLDKLFHLSSFSAWNYPSMFKNL